MPAPSHMPKMTTSRRFYSRTAAGTTQERGKCRSYPHVSCFRTSQAFPPSSTSRTLRVRVRGRGRSESGNDARIVSRRARGGVGKHVRWGRMQINEWFRSWFVTTNNLWDVPWTWADVVRFMAWWMAAFCFVGVIAAPSLVRMVGIDRATLGYGGQALYALCTDLLEFAVTLAVARACLGGFVGGKENNNQATKSQNASQMPTTMPTRKWAAAPVTATQKMNASDVNGASSAKTAAASFPMRLLARPRRGSGLRKLAAGIAVGCLCFPLVDRLSHYNRWVVSARSHIPVTSSSRHNHHQTSAAEGSSATNTATSSSSSSKKAYTVSAAPPLEQTLSATGGLASNAAYVIVVSLCCPLWEEMVFRGILLPSLCKYLPPAWAVLASAAAFAGAHFAPSRTLPLAFLGLVLGTAMVSTRSIAAPIALHAMWNSHVLYTALTAAPL
ncbi:CAAX prenyl protease 2 [Pseudoscourfieldia marina]